jgi:Leucine-rich repeat (LRR) protein
LHAETIIANCLDSQEEVVDLGNLNLKQIPGTLLSPLLLLTRRPNFLDRAQPPSEVQFQSLKPHIQLFLAHNQLTVLPAVTWNLDSLRVLSLRHNRLESLPGSISRLRNLVELNVGNNNLRWLPWELLKLLSCDSPLRRFSVEPNPFLRAFDVGNIVGSRDAVWTAPATDKEYADLLKNFRLRYLRDTSTRMAFMLKLMNRLPVLPLAPQTMGNSPGEEKPLHLVGHTTHIASAPVSYMDYDGLVPRGSSLPPSRLPVEVAIIPASTNTKTRKNMESVVPSLLELALRSAISVEKVENVKRLFPETLPVPVLRGLAQATAAQSEGGRTCSVCNRDYLIPRAEWIEFWHYLPDLDYSCPIENLFLPFLRRGCSPGCVQ